MSDVDEHLFLCDSHNRTRELLLAMMRERSARERILLFLEWGNVCDAPWACRSYFAELLRRSLTEVRLRDILPTPERAWFDSLDTLILVYRGCEKKRERGLSWTTDLEVAKRFAVGMRCYNRHPTLLSAYIPKQHIFALFLDRSESEVVVDPRRLRQLNYLPYVSPEI